jgi:hypothetical protein
MIVFMSQLSVVNYYIHFVHVHLKQFHEQERKSEERIVLLLNKTF